MLSTVRFCTLGRVLKAWAQRAFRQKGIVAGIGRTEQDVVCTCTGTCEPGLGISVTIYNSSNRSGDALVIKER